MAIPKGHKFNFSTLQDAGRSNHLALLECQDKKTKKLVFVVTAITFDGKEYDMVPLAKMFDGNPYEEVSPPNPDGGFYE